MLWPRTPRAKPYNVESEAMTPEKLCERTFEGRDFGWKVRVAFKLPLTPTKNSRIFEYHPGVPAFAVTPTIRIIFAEPPKLLAKYPVIVGTVLSIQDDNRRQASGRHGLVIISEARPSLEFVR